VIRALHKALGSMEKAWKMLADRDIYDILKDMEKLDEDFMRLLLLEMFNRIRKLEQVNFALQALLVREGVLDEDALKQTMVNAKQYLDEKDTKKSEMSKIIKSSGITFEEWVSFILHGTFNKK